MLIKNSHCLLNKFIFVYFAFLLLIFHQTNTQQIFYKVQECLQYKKGYCIKCPINFHLKNQQCYQNIIGCIQYKYFTNSAICMKCSPMLSKLTNNSTCQIIFNSIKSNITNFNPNLIRIRSSVSNFNQTNNLISTFISQQETTFRQISTKQLANDTYFQKCNNFMRSGQYSHFISRSQNPIYSAFFYISKGIRQYKILYQGSGGNMLLCLIGISIETSSITLRAFVTIGRNNIVDSCVDYSTSLQCLKCQQGYHLDTSSIGQKICIINIPGCINYFRNICLKCRGSRILVENRCLSDCIYLRDTRSIKHNGNFMILLNSQKQILSQTNRNYLIIN